MLSGLLSACSERRLLSSCGGLACPCGGFSCCRVWALGCAGFRSCDYQTLGHRLSSCASWASLLHSMCSFPGSGIQPLSPTLATGFSTTELPGKPLQLLKFYWSILIYNVSFWCISSVVTQSCPTLRNPMGCCMPDFPVHHQLLELAQTHVHQVSDAIQPSHPLLSPSPHAFNLFQYQSLFQLVSSLRQVAKVLELQH